jgi:hypothetical protein
MAALFERFSDPLVFGQEYRLNILELCQRPLRLRDVRPMRFEFGDILLLPGYVSCARRDMHFGQSKVFEKHRAIHARSSRINQSLSLQDDA